VLQEQSPLQATRSAPFAKRGSLQMATFVVIAQLVSGVLMASGSGATRGLQARLLAPQATAHAKHVLLDPMQLWQGCPNASSVLKARSRVQAVRSHAASVVLGQQAH